jgi:hypothetical protein
VRYLPPLGRIGGLVGDVSAFLRRRRDSRKPRVRVRLEHGETRVLPEGDKGRDRLLALAGELVGEYGKGGRARP